MFDDKQDKKMKEAVTNYERMLTARRLAMRPVKPIECRSICFDCDNARIMQREKEFVPSVTCSYHGPVGLEIIKCKEYDPIGEWNIARLGTIAMMLDVVQDDVREIKKKMEKFFPQRSDEEKTSRLVDRQNMMKELLYGKE